MSYVGYEWLRQRLSLSAFEMDRPARVRPVTRVMPAEGLPIGKPCDHRAPSSDQQFGRRSAPPILRLQLADIQCLPVDKKSGKDYCAGKKTKPEADRKIKRKNCNHYRRQCWIWAENCLCFCKRGLQSHFDRKTRRTIAGGGRKMPGAWRTGHLLCRRCKRGKDRNRNRPAGDRNLWQGGHPDKQCGHRQGIISHRYLNGRI